MPLFFTHPQVVADAANPRPDKLSDWRTAATPRKRATYRPALPWPLSGGSTCASSCKGATWQSPQCPPRRAARDVGKWLLQ